MDPSLFAILFLQDFIILDEGHKIKNQNKTSKSVRSIPAKNHFILTGTPIQNNLSVSSESWFCISRDKIPFIENVPTYWKK